MYFVRAVQEGNATLTLLFEKFYAAHTPALSRVLFCIEYIVFKGSNYLPKIVALMAIVGSMLIFYKNIQGLALKKSERLLLKITGLLLAFGAAQLYTFNYPWAGFQHPSAIFFCLLSLHIFSSDIQHERNISIPRALIYLALCATGSLFTAIGIFGMAIILFGMILYRTPLKSILVYTAGLLILFYFLKPGQIIIRITDLVDVTLTINETTIIEKAGAPLVPFFFGFSNYVFGFTGAILETVSKNSAIFAGSIIFLIFSMSSLLHLFERRKNLIFFQLTLYMLMAYAIVAGWGRYQASDHQFDRYAAIYPWLLWSGCAMTIASFRKIGIALSLTLCFLAIATAPLYINKQLAIQQDSTQADINLVNNSLIHMTYQKTPTPLKLFGFKPDVFHEFLKTNRWGMYQHYTIPELSPIGNSKCEAIKTKEFIVSEKQFVEYQLDGWNISTDTYLPSLYALDSNNQIIAQGASMPRSLSWIPTYFLPREKVMIYLIVPRTYTLGSLRLVGGRKGDWCEVTLLKK